ncbi:Carbonic anhydrase 2 [Symbiodinium microadriaticum]|uniref:carbonic anhydrase n=1 Tax=Symbiodinium microadriaticum TaxID=2951 RepID=A0A1Q9E811_SYMMI|nr:Carbonic anhydrase 2 [Symbiodinium microadriaticum]
MPATLVPDAAAEPGAAQVSALRRIRTLPSMQEAEIAFDEGTEQRQPGSFPLMQESSMTISMTKSRNGYTPPTSAESMRKASDVRKQSKPMSRAVKALPPHQALLLLKAGNERFVRGRPMADKMDHVAKQQNIELVNAPHTAVVGCADSRFPLEKIFDAMPGDIYSLRNAANTCTHAEGSMMGSLEFCSSTLGSRLIVVLGHSECKAIVSATRTYFEAKKAGKSLLGHKGLLRHLTSLVEKTVASMPMASMEEVANQAITANVLNTMNFLLQFSDVIRDRVRSGQLEIVGGLFDLQTGRVDFLGPSPDQAVLLDPMASQSPNLSFVPLTSQNTPPPQSHDRGPSPNSPAAALLMLQEGNARFCLGDCRVPRQGQDMRKALASCPQATYCAIVGCADQRTPIDSIFDAMPGELFVVKNAGNTCSHTEGSVIGSLEFCTSKLETSLILVLGHSDCSAMHGATKMFLAAQSGKSRESLGPALDGLLDDLMVVISKAFSLYPKANAEELAHHAVKLNVENTMECLLRCSSALIEAIARREEASSSSEDPMPASAEVAIKLLKEGNGRFVGGTAVANRISPEVRKNMVPLETIFDALPGDLFVLRNAGNTCTHAQGSMVSSLEFCVDKLQTQLILVLGHTQCYALARAAEAHQFPGKGDRGKASDALVEGMAASTAAAMVELGETASMEEVTNLATKWNVFHTIQCLLQYSQPIRDKVLRGALVLQGAVYDSHTHRVEFLECPEAVLKGGAVWESPPQWAGA